MTSFLFYLAPAILSSTDMVFSVIRAVVEYKPIRIDSIEEQQSEADQGQAKPAVDDSELNMKDIFCSIFLWALHQGLNMFLSLILALIVLDSGNGDAVEQPVKMLAGEPIEGHIYKPIDEKFEERFEERSEERFEEEFEKQIDKPIEEEVDEKLGEEFKEEFKRPIDEPIKEEVDEEFVEELNEEIKEEFEKNVHDKFEEEVREKLEDEAEENFDKPIEQNVKDLFVPEFEE